MTALTELAIGTITFLALFVLFILMAPILAVPLSLGGLAWLLGAARSWHAGART